MGTGKLLPYSVDEHFGLFLERLKKQETAEWKWLLFEFRKVVLPWLRKKAQPLPVGGNMNMQDFLEEVFANSLFQFCKLFKEGNFENVHQIKSLLFRISELKLKEGYKKVHRDYLIFRFLEEMPASLNNHHNWNEANLNRLEQIQKITEQFKKLPVEDQHILRKFANGEQLKDIAKHLGISASACRKRKERALSKLKTFVLKDR